MSSPSHRRNSSWRSSSHTDPVIDLTEDVVELVPKSTIEKTDWRNSYTYTARHDPRRAVPLKSAPKKPGTSPRVVDLTSNGSKPKSALTNSALPRDEYDDGASRRSAPNHSAVNLFVEDKHKRNTAHQTAFVDLDSSDGLNDFSRSLPEAHARGQSSSHDPWTDPDLRRQSPFADPFACFESQKGDDVLRAIPDPRSPMTNHASSTQKAPIANMYMLPTPAVPIRNFTKANVQQRQTKQPLQTSHTKTVNVDIDDRRDTDLQGEHNALQKRREAKQAAIEAEKKRFAAKEREDLAAVIRQTTQATKQANPQNINLGFAAVEDILEQPHSSDTGTDEPGIKDCERAKLNKPRRFQALCPICKKEHDRPSCLQRHFEACIKKNGNPKGMSWDDSIKSPFKDLERGSNEARSFRCPLCNTAFAHRNAFKSHLLTVHSAAEGSSSTDQISEPKMISLQAPVDVFANVASQKRHKSQSEFPLIGQSVLQPNRKRILQDVPVDTLFAPGQIATKREFEKYTEAVRQKKAQKWNANEQALENQQANRCTSVQDSGNGLTPATEPSKNSSRMDIDSGSSSPNSKSSDAQALSPSDTTVDQAEKLDHTTMTHNNNEHSPAFQRQDNQETLLDMWKTNSLPSVGHISDGISKSGVVDVEDCLAAEKPQTVSKLPIHPTTGGKGISAATLAIWDAKEKEAEEALETPDVIYVYLVTICNWGNGLPEDRASTQNMGPYHTLAEANAVASNEVKYLDHLEKAFEPQPGGHRPKLGWSYNYTEDDHGMQTHTMIVRGFHTEAAVHRGMLQPAIDIMTSTHYH